MGRYLLVVVLAISGHAFALCNGVKPQRMVQIQSQFKTCVAAARSDDATSQCNEQMAQACLQAENDPSAVDASGSTTGSRSQGMISEAQGYQMLDQSGMGIAEWVRQCKNGGPKKPGSPLSECDAAGAFYTQIGD